MFEHLELEESSKSIFHTYVYLPSTWAHGIEVSLNIPPQEIGLGTGLHSHCNLSRPGHHASAVRHLLFEGWGCLLLNPQGGSRC